MTTIFCDRRPLYATLLVFLLALPPRLWYATRNPLWNNVTTTSRYYPDSRDYDILARNLLAGKGFSLSLQAPYKPTTIRLPAYPLFLATIYRFCGHSYRCVLAAQVLLGAVACALLFWMGFWVGGLRAGVLAGLLNAFNPRWGAFYASELLSEQLAIFQFTLAGFLFVWTVRTRSLTLAALLSALSGGVTGWAMLCKPALIPFLPCLLLLGYGATWAMRERVTVGLLAFACAVAVLTPWVVRNKRAFGAYSVSMGGGMILWARTYDRGLRCDYGDPKFRRDLFTRWRTLEKQGLKDPDIGATFRRWAMATIRAHPFRYLAGSLLEMDSFLGFGLMPLFRHEHGPPEIWDVPAPRVLFRSITRFIFYALAVVGMCLTMRTHRGGYFLLILMMVVFTLAHVLFCLCSHRYSEPIMPFAFLFCAVALNAYPKTPCHSERSEESRR